MKLYSKLKKMLLQIVNKKVDKDVQKKLKDRGVKSHDLRLKVFESFIEHSMEKTLSIQKQIVKKQ